MKLGAVAAATFAVAGREYDRYIPKQTKRLAWNELGSKIETVVSSIIHPKAAKK